MERPMEPGRRRIAATARALERGLFAVGVVCLLIYAAACAHSAHTQAQQSRVFDAALDDLLAEGRAASLLAEEHDVSEWSAARVADFERSRNAPVSEALGRLEIPSAGVSVMVLDGTDDWTLNRAVGHIEGTAAPGEAGNVGIAGHRDGFFRGLRHVEVGDPLSLTTLDGVRHYEVVEISIVDPDDVAVLDPTREPSLTLVTCHPFYYVGDAPDRFIVHARQVSYEPWGGRRAAIPR